MFSFIDDDDDDGVISHRRLVESSGDERDGTECRMCLCLFFDFRLLLLLAKSDAATRISNPKILDKPTK